MNLSRRPYHLCTCTPLICYINNIFFFFFLIFSSLISMERNVWYTFYSWKMLFAQPLSDLIDSLVVSFFFLIHPEMKFIQNPCNCNVQQFFWIEELRIDWRREDHEFRNSRVNFMCKQIQTDNFSVSIRVKDASIEK